MSGFDHAPTAEEKRASLSYLVGFTDGLMWAIAHQEELGAMLYEALGLPEKAARPRIQSVSFAASELYDGDGADPWADPERWGRRIDEIMDIEPDPDWRPPS